MKIGVPDNNDDIVWLEIRRARNVLPGHIGYRKGNDFLLRDDVFQDFHTLHCASNFPAMRRILDQAIDINALPWDDKRKINL